MNQLVVIQSQDAEFCMAPVDKARGQLEVIRVASKCTGRQYDNVIYARHDEHIPVHGSVDCIMVIDHEIVREHIKFLPAHIESLIFLQFWESFSAPNFQVINEMLSHHEKIWWVNCDMSVHQKKDIPHNVSVAAYDFFSGYTLHGMSEWFKPAPTMDLEQRDFLCLNNTPRPGRKFMVESLHRYGLAGNGYISFYKQLLEGASPFSDDLSEFGTSGFNMPTFWDITPWTSKVYFEIVGEHVIDSNRFKDEDFIFFTEKTYRCMLNGLPFLMSGKPGSLEYLRHMGYQTFDGLFDESYDTVTNWKSRIQMIVAQVKKFSKLTDADKKIWRKEAQSVVDHNRMHLLHNYNKLYIEPVNKEQ